MYVLVYLQTSNAQLNSNLIRKNVIVIELHNIGSVLNTTQ